MDALITAAGKGTRANLPSNMRKEMLPVYSMRNNNIVLRPMIDCIIYNLNKINIKKFFIVLNKNDKFTENYLKSLDYNIEYIYQDKPEGFGNAVLIAKNYIKDDFILNAGDGIILNENKMKSIINLYKNKKNNVLTLMKVSNPENYGIAKINNEYVLKVDEKPEDPESNYALAAFYILKKEIFDYIKYIELTPAINDMIKSNINTNYFKINRYDWISIGNSNNYYKILERTYKYYKKLFP